MLGSPLCTIWSSCHRSSMCSGTRARMRMDGHGRPRREAHIPKLVVTRSGDSLRMKFASMKWTKATCSSSFSVLPTCFKTMLRCNFGWPPGTVTSKRRSSTISPSSLPSSAVWLVATAIPASVAFSWWPRSPAFSWTTSTCSTRRTQTQSWPFWTRFLSS